MKIRFGQWTGDRAIANEITCLATALAAHRERCLRDGIRQHVRDTGALPAKVWMLSDETWSTEKVEGYVQVGTSNPPDGASWFSLEMAGWPRLTQCTRPTTGEQTRLLVWPNGDWDTVEEMELDDMDSQFFSEHVGHTAETAELTYSRPPASVSDDWGAWQVPSDPEGLLKSIERYEDEVAQHAGYFTAAQVEAAFREGFEKGGEQIPDEEEAWRFSATRRLLEEA